MPKLWSDTVEEHRRSVRDATLDATAALVAQQGLLSVTMSEIAEKTGIGRATLYKYFPDVESVLMAWHERQVAAHLDQLAQVRAQSADPGRRLEAVVYAYALMAQESAGQHDNAVATVLHRDGLVAEGERQLHDLMRDLVVEAAAAGGVRDDIPPAELAAFCLHALSAARGLPSKAAAHRLATVTLAGLRRPAGA